MTDFRLVSMVDALDAALSELERRYERSEAPEDTDPRLVTGVPGIDRLLGGVPTGQVTLLTVDHEVHAEALAASVIRNSPHATLFAAPDLLDATRTILASTARVPRAFIASGHLTDGDWARIASACGELRDRRVSMTTCSSATGILHAARSAGARLVVVLFPERLGSTLDAALDLLDAEVSGAHIALVAMTTADAQDADATVLATSSLSSTLELVTTDPADLLRRTTVTIDRLCRHAS